MSSHDISRHLFQTANHYTGVRMQQGRVVLDSDFNEARMLDEEDQRKLVVDVVGPHGSPDDGFTIASVSTVGAYNFQIGAGTYYLGGYRHEIVGDAGPLSPQTFRAQTNWRQSSRADENPAPPTIPAAARHDFVYLVGWEQGVGAVEDAELREEALPGPHDTGYRIRRMNRVHVVTDGGASCKAGFDALVASLEAGGHDFDRANFELKSGARLAVVYDPLAPAEDLCTPRALQGFAGAENQAIRVLLIEPGRFLWSFDDAAPLYRGIIGALEPRLVLQTAPRDHAHFPRVGQVVEILPWGATLANGEQVADYPIAGNIGGGVLARVVADYNPDNGVVEIVVEDEDAFGELLTWFDTEEVDEGDRFVFVRVWNPGDGAAAGPIGLPFVPGEPVTLGTTGLQLTFSQEGIVGDHWVVGVRPATQRPIVPWNLVDGAAPHGPRRFYSPLAVIHWSTVGGLHATVESCRRTFRPLTRLRGCCTVTVGDGETSFGDFTSISEAIAAIPLDEPGRICVLPGEYRESLLLFLRSNIVIEGCGARTVIRSPEDTSASFWLINIAGGSNVTLRDLTIDAIGQVGVRLNASQYTTLERLVITSRRDPSVPPAQDFTVSTSPGALPYPLSTLRGTQPYHLIVRDCKLTMIGDISAYPNVFLDFIIDAVIERCEISTPAPPGGVSQAWGGIYLNNDVDIQIRDCTITEGLGHGITLGGVTTVGGPGSYFPFTSLPLDLGPDCPGNSGGLPFTAPFPDTGVPYTVLPDDVEKIVIRGNRITNMGSSGISVLGFWPLPEDPEDEYPMILATEIEIADNLIENNCRRPLPVSDDLLELAAFGGIVLAAADSVRIHDNRIVGNGVNHTQPVCGVYILHGEDIVVENNEIRANGPRIDGTALPGIRAGVALQLVGRRVTPDDSGGFVVGSQTLLLAARVRGNVVHQPAGRALQIYGIGPIFVEGNTLISEGLTGAPTYAAHCVEIWNIGQSPELGLPPLYMPAFSAMFAAPPLLYDPGEIDDRLLDGRILFTDNQVRFNPAPGASFSVHCVTRLQSYGDVAVLDNQFFTHFPPSGGQLLADTIVCAWSTRTNNNRWEDPIEQDADGAYATGLSAFTLGVMNFTTLNEASRCIAVQLPVGGPTILNNPVGINIIYSDTDCLEDFETLLVAP